MPVSTASIDRAICTSADVVRVVDPAASATARATGPTPLRRAAAAWPLPLAAAGGGDGAHRHAADRPLEVAAPGRG